MAAQDYSKLLSTLDDHLRKLSDPVGDEKIDEELISIARLQLLPTTPETVFSRRDRQFLIMKIFNTIPHVGQPASLVRLLKQLLEPVPLAALFEIDPPVDFAAGLDLNAVDFHDLTLSLLEKAEQKSAERLATLHRDVYEALVKLWLCTPKEGTGAKAGSVLFHHLEVGREPVLKRIFRDKDIYELMFAFCSLDSNNFLSLSKTQKSVAQSRLMNWLHRVAGLSWDVIANSHLPDIESQYGLDDGEGLLDFAARHMVDYKNDVLMYQALITFYWKLILSQRERLDREGNSDALRYFVSHKIHARIVKIFTSSTSLSQSTDDSLVATDSALYVAAYVSVHPELFCSAKNEQERVIQTIRDTLTSTRVSQWVDEPPEVSRVLEVLSCLPAQALLGTNSPILLVPSKQPSPGAFGVLGMLFHGPPTENEYNMKTASKSSKIASEPMLLPSNDDYMINAAKALFEEYASHNPRLWTDITSHGTLYATPDVASAAHNFLQLLITARWDSLEVIMRNSDVISYLLTVPDIPVAVIRSETREILIQRYTLARVLLERLQKSGDVKWAEAAVQLRRRVDGRALCRSHGGNIATLGA
jgi:hypothetical protein